MKGEMEISKYIEDSKLFILLEWRRRKRCNKNLSEDLVCVISEATISFQDRVELLARSGAKGEWLAQPAGKSTPEVPIPNALWVIFSNPNERGMVRLVDVGASDEVVETRLLVQIIANGMDSVPIKPNTEEETFELYCINPFIREHFALLGDVWRVLLKMFKIEEADIEPSRIARSIAFTPSGLIFVVVLGNVTRPTQIRPYYFSMDLVQAFFGDNFVKTFNECQKENILVEESIVHAAWREVADAMNVSLTITVMVDPGPETTAFAAPGGTA